VDPAVRDRLFEPFATGRPDGTGLGLAVSRRIVQRHGGELRHLPEVAPGAAFELRVPLATA
jgi:signal transduction histidine kinase